MKQVFAAILLSLLLSNAAHADVLSLQSGDASYDHNSDTPGSDNLVHTVSGDTLFQETWYFRAVDTFGMEVTEELANGTATGSGTSAGSLDFGTLIPDFFGNGFDLSVDYQLEDVAGFGPNLTYQLSVTNNRNSSANVSVFQYFDHDIFGAGGDNISYDGSGDPTLELWDDNGTDEFRFSRVGTGATGFETGTFGDDIDGSILGGGSLDSIDDDVLDQDVAGAFQWDLNLAAGETVVISGGSFVSVPEPASALLLAGIGGFLISRRRR